MTTFSLLTDKAKIVAFAAACAIRIGGVDYKVTAREWHKCPGRVIVFVDSDRPGENVRWKSAHGSFLLSEHTEWTEQQIEERMLEIVQDCLGRMKPTSLWKTEKVNV